jgi:hypothetical protein
MRDRYQRGRCPYCNDRILPGDLKNGSRLCKPCRKDPGYHLVPKKNGNGTRRLFHPDAGVVKAAKAMRTPCGICHGTGNLKGFYLRGKWIEPRRCGSCRGRGYVGARVKVPSDAKNGYWLLEEVFGPFGNELGTVTMKDIYTRRGALENYGLDIDDYF